MKQSRWDDHYARLAKTEKWLARSVYKLQEIDRRFKLFQRGNRILDLGCSPGSWAQYALQRTGGEIVGLDVTPPARSLGGRFRFVEADVLQTEPVDLARQLGYFDVLISDLAPKTTGIRLTDAARSLELAQRAAEIAFAVLKAKGHFVCKIFEGGEEGAFRSEISASFRRVRLFRPAAVRKGSREIYMVSLNLLRRN